MPSLETPSRNASLIVERLRSLAADPSSKVQFDLFMVQVFLGHPRVSVAGYDFSLAEARILLGELDFLDSLSSGSYYLPSLGDPDFLLELNALRVSLENLEGFRGLSFIKSLRLFIAYVSHSKILCRGFLMALEKKILERGGFQDVPINSFSDFYRAALYRALSTAGQSGVLN